MKRDNDAELALGVRPNQQHEPAATYKITINLPRIVQCR